jgi:hypothetical protein
LRTDGVRAFGEQQMPDWKADLDALVEKTIAFTKCVQAQTVLPNREPTHIPPLSWMNSEREDIEHRVANFRAHQQELIAERENYAASQIKRMRASLNNEAKR